MDALPQSADRPSEQMEKLLAGHFLAQCLHAAAVLAIPDLIAKGCSTIEELASATGSHGPSLHRLLRALASIGLFTEGANGRLVLTPLGDTLRSDSPDSVRDKALFECSMPIWSAWGHVLDSLRTGRPALSGAQRDDLGVSRRQRAGRGRLQSFHDRAIAAAQRGDHRGL